jgi:hypothetical protein
MLFSFPHQALASNWLNEKVIEILVLGLDAIDAGGQPVAWPNCLPGDRREVLRRRRGLKPKLDAIWQEYSDLDGAGRQAVRHAVSRQTELPAVFSDALPCLKLSQLPESIRQSAEVVSRKLWKFPGGALRACEGWCSQAARSRCIGSMG